MSSVLASVFCLEHAAIGVSDSGIGCSTDTEYDTDDGYEQAEVESRDKREPRILNRIAEVRKQQGVSLRTVSRRTGLDVKTLREQEKPGYNLSLRQLLAWQQALDVPIADLVESDSDPLSRPVKERAQLVRIMKTAASIRELKSATRIRRLSQMLCEQLEQLMPELRDIGAWPQYGSRRGNDILSKILEQPVCTELIERSE